MATAVWNRNRDGSLSQRAVPFALSALSNVLKRLFCL